MNAWQPVDVVCPHCGATVQLNFAPSERQVTSDEGAPVTWLRLATPVMHVCRTPEQPHFGP